MKNPIHVAIIRKVKPGKEQAFESAVLKFFEDALADKGSFGAQLISSLPGSSDRAYGILRSFAGKQDRDRFYQSKRFLDWEKTVKPLVENEYTRKDLHGLEAFFTDPGAVNRPPRWKMAIVTWFGVWPSVLVIFLLVSPLLPDLPIWVAIGFNTLLVVVALTWVVMPLLIKVFRPWLIKPSNGT
jgi:antibiotic biosynthesis monooxygenase (ABM) superfamily enzyme